MKIESKQQGLGTQNTENTENLETDQKMYSVSLSCNEDMEFSVLGDVDW